MRYIRPKPKLQCIKKMLEEHYFAVTPALRSWPGSGTLLRRLVSKTLPNLYINLKYRGKAFDLCCGISPTSPTQLRKGGAS